MARKSREIVLAALRSSDGFATAQSVHGRAVALGDPIGLATVYRTLRQLADDDLIDQMFGDDGQVQYRFCAGEHHHHLTCRQCSATIEIEADAVEVWSHELASRFGFSDVRHVLELSGVCPACQSN